MSYLASELEQLMREKNLRASDVARISGLDKTTVSRFRNGSQIWIGTKDLERLAGAFDNTEQTHARLLRAHLLDECQGPGKDLIEIEITARKRPATLREESLPYGVKLTDKVNRALGIVAKQISSDKDLQKIIFGLADLYEKGSLSS